MRPNVTRHIFLKKGNQLLWSIVLTGVLQTEIFAQQTTIPLCNQTIPYSGMTYGYWFTAPTDMTICALYVPDSITSNTNHWGGAQWLEVVRFTAGPPPTSGTTNNFVSIFTSYGQIINGKVPANIVINAGDQIGIYGSRDPFCYNSGYWNMSANDGRCTTQINGFNVQLTPSGMSLCLVQGPMANIWQRTNTWMSRVFFDYNCCENPVTNDTIQGQPLVCRGDTVTFQIDSVQHAISYIWSGPFDAALIAGQGTKQATFIFNNFNGDVCLRAVGTCGDTVLLACKTVQVLKPTAAFNLPNTACVGETISVSYTGAALPDLSYDWDFGSAVITGGTDAGPYQLFWDAAGSYAVSLTVMQMNCPSPEEIKIIEVAEIPQVTFSLSADTVCANETVTLQLTGDAGFSWTWDFDDAEVLSNTNPYQFSFSVSGVKNILGEGANACGTVQHSEFVFVRTMPPMDFEASATLGCAPLTVTFNYQNPAVQQLEWHFGDGTISADNPASHVFPAGEFDIRLMLTDLNGCEYETTQPAFIKAVALPSADFTVQPGFNQPVQLSEAAFIFTNQSQNANSYQWNFGDGNVSAGNNPVHTYADTGSFIITLIASAEGICFDSIARSFINVAPDAAYFVPNAFSPNEDGVNDMFMLFGSKENITNFSVMIFNRWGSKVFESNSPDFRWDGTISGKRANPDVFVYAMDFDAGKNKYRLKGSVTLIR